MNIKILINKYIFIQSIFITLFFTHCGCVQSQYLLHTYRQAGKAMQKCVGTHKEDDQCRPPSRRSGTSERDHLYRNQPQSPTT